ncbi:MAG: hypothetical protein R6U61_05960 [Thermoplasmata archaeon]
MLKLKYSKGNAIFLEAAVKGLISKAEELLEECKKTDFDVGALPISMEDLDGLRYFIDNPDDFDLELSTPEKAYARNLQEFGEVSMPPPSYISFYEYCIENGIPVHGIDMDDEHYTMAYCEHVSGLQWIRQSFLEKKLLKTKIEASTPEEFAVKWDERINHLSGYSDLERHRERVMGKNLARLSKSGTVFSIVEVERMDGVVEELKRNGYTS